MKPQIRTALFLTIVLAGVALPAAAQDADTRQDSTRVIDRMDAREADEVLVTRRGDVALLIAGPDLVVQLTDRGLEGLSAEEDEPESLAARLMSTMLAAGLRELLDHGMATPIVEIHRAEVVGERLVLEDAKGEELFGLTVNDRDVMDDFEAEEARAFARQIRARMP